MKNDLIIKYQGQDITDSASLQSRVSDTTVGEKASLTVLRDGKPVNLTVKIGNMEDAMLKIAGSLENRLGVVVRPVTADEAQKYGLNPAQGVAIKSVDANGVLGKAGFETNDIILGVNNTPVEGVEGFVSLFKSLPPNQKIVINALDHRTGQSGFVQVTIE